MDLNKAFIEEDFKKLSALARAVRGGPHPERAAVLADRLDGALIFRREEASLDFVAMGSTVRVSMTESGEAYRYLLVFPVDADISRGRISVLSPLGASLLGRRAGESFSYESPGGLVQARVEAVEAPAEEILNAG